MCDKKLEFILIKGTYHVVGSSPDGDTLKFKANNKNNWKKIIGTPKFNTKDQTPLRIEGIDALETHYTPTLKGKKATETHQPLALANSAKDFLLKTLGIKNVVWNKTGSTVVSANDGIAGYILTQGVDNNRFRRPVAFAFAGSTAKTDGSTVCLTINELKNSANYKSLEAGQSYPTYYKTLAANIRDEMTKAVLKARAAKLGIWGKDKSPQFTFNNLQTLTDDVVIFPKLFRRLVEFIEGGGKIAAFGAFLQSKKDGVLVMPQADHKTSLDGVITVSGKIVKMHVLPENVIFDPQV